MAYEGADVMQPLFNQSYPEYDLSDQPALTGHTTILHFTALFTVLHVTIPVTPIYIAIILIRSKIIKSLNGAELMAATTKKMHAQLLKVNYFL